MYEITVKRFDEPYGSTLGLASINYGNVFQINNIRIMQSQSTGNVFVSMPQHKTNKTNPDDNSPVYEDVFCPITKEFREKLYDNILDAFDLNDKLVCEAEITEPVKYDVTVIPYSKVYNHKAGKASLYLDNRFAINNIKILVNDRGNFSVGMPSVKTKKTDENGEEIWNDIVFPKTKDFAKEFYGFVTQKANEKINLAALEEERNQQEQAQNAMAAEAPFLAQAPQEPTPAQKTRGKTR